MIRISTSISSQPVISMLERMQRSLSDPAPVLEGIGAELQGLVLDRFEMQRDPSGQAWEPWADSTRADYPSNGHKRILDRYGDMLRSLTRNVGPDFVEVGFGAVASKARDVYAIYHEWGTATMPRRGLLMDDPDAGTLGSGDEAAILEIVEDWLNRLT